MGEEEDKQEEEIPEEIKALISPDEKVLYVAKQKGSKFKPDLTKRIFPGMMVVTDRRILRMQPKGLVRGALGMRRSLDYPYEDMKSIFLERGAFRSTLRVSWKSHLDTGHLPEIRDIDKEEAEAVYGIVREILARQSSKPAAAPVVISAQPAQPAQAAEDPIQKLEKLGKLKEAGVISEEEFQQKKKELLKKI